MEKYRDREIDREKDRLRGRKIEKEVVREKDMGNEVK
jgi:hypothetical protein